MNKNSRNYLNTRSREIRTALLETLQRGPATSNALRAAAGIHPGRGLVESITNLRVEMAEARHPMVIKSKRGSHDVTYWLDPRPLKIANL